MIVSFQDEFGGYSSRLRIKHGDKSGPVEGDDVNVEQNLCELLGIDVEDLALKLAQGIDPWADQDESDTEMQQEDVS